MAALVSLADVKAAVSVLHSDDDALLTSLSEAASELVIGYLGAQAASHLELDENGDFTGTLPVKPAIHNAVLAVCQDLYDGKSEAMAHGALPRRAEMLLYRLADPPLA